MQVRFEVQEFHSDGGFRPASYRIRGGADTGWTVERDSGDTLRLGPGYRLLRTWQCGVCSTDLARAHLPFPLPQVIGHELIAFDEDGRRHVVEINASHDARGIASDCPFCRRGLATHCPDRLVLGIHDLPGGFGPWVLAPTHAVVPVPNRLPDATAVLAEPFAAALHAVETVRPRDGDVIAVLGPRRLGMLVVAAAAAWRERTRVHFELVALSRHDALLDLARRLGADRGERVDGDASALADASADVVIDTTGNPDALPLALRLARREVHVKSTHGRPSAGLAHLTELVVDELRIAPLPDVPPASVDAPHVAWLSSTAVPASWRGTRVQRDTSAATVLTAIERATVPGDLPRADLAVVDSIAQCDDVIRPDRDREIALIAPRGTIFVTDRVAADTTPLGAALQRGVCLSSSRCGDFRAALELLGGSECLRDLGARLVTHVLPAGRMAEAFTTARSPDCIKAVVEHPSRPWPPDPVGDAAG